MKCKKKKKRILKFSNFISYAISIITGEHHFFSYDWKYGFHGKSLVNFKFKFSTMILFNY